LIRFEYVCTFPPYARSSFVFASNSIPYSSGTNSLFPPSFSPSLPLHLVNERIVGEQGNLPCMYALLQNSRKGQDNRYEDTKVFFVLLLGPMRAPGKRTQQHNRKTQKQSNWVSKQRPPPPCLHPSLRSSPADLYHVAEGSRFLQSRVKSSEQASPLENRTSILSSLRRDCKGIQHSSPLVEKPARPLVAAALHSALLALDSTRLQTSESRHARSLTRGAGIGTSTSTERLRDAAEGVVGEVGLRGRAAGAAEAARGALFGGLEAFFDGEEL
jgi:hypothetical protein